MFSTRMVFALALAMAVTFEAQAQTQIRHPAPRRVQVSPTTLAAAPAPAPAAVPAAPSRPSGLLSTVTLGDIGFLTGLRFANLGGFREIFVPLPQGNETASELVLVFDDVSAHEAKRSLEILVNDRSALAIVLDGKSMGRTVRVPLPRTKAKDGFLKLSFLYSGAATQDRCIDVRYVGDSLTVRPETAIEIDLGAANRLDVATTAALMPRNVTIVLPNRRLTPSDIATALTVARALAASGRHVEFHHGYDGVQEPVNTGEQRRWARGLVVIGTLDEAASYHRGAVYNGRRSGSRFWHARRSARRRCAGAARLRRFGGSRRTPAGEPVTRRDPRRVRRLGRRDRAAGAVERSRHLRPTRRCAGASRRVRPRRPHGGNRHAPPARRYAAARLAARPHGRARRRGREGGGERLMSTNVCSAVPSPRSASRRISISRCRTASSAPVPTSAPWCSAAARRATAGSSRRATRRKSWARAASFWRPPIHMPTISPILPRAGPPASRCCCRRSPPNSRR